MKEHQSVRWKGYFHQDGRKGIRSKLLVVYTVECSSYIAKEIARCTDSSNVDVVGFDGCCDNEYAARLLLVLIRRPNVRGVLTVGLGCEYVQSGYLAEEALKAEKPAWWLFAQEYGGTEPSIEYGLQQTHLLLEKLRQIPAVPMDFSNLTVGIECGGPGYTSDLTGDVVVGHSYDKLVDLGGTAVFEEIVETAGLKGLLVQRAADDCAWEQLAYIYSRVLKYRKSMRQHSASPGNFAGRLSPTEEKNTGVVIRGGNHPISGMIKASQQPPKDGLWLPDNIPDLYWMGLDYTSSDSNEGLAGLISCGCQLASPVTGRGNIAGSAVALVYKIAGDGGALHRMSGDTGFNAGSASSGEAILEQLCQNLCDGVIRVCFGEPINARKLGHKEYFISYKYQEKEAVVKRKCK